MSDSATFASGVSTALINSAFNGTNAFAEYNTVAASKNGWSDLGNMAGRSNTGKSLFNKTVGAIGSGLSYAWNKTSDAVSYTVGKIGDGFNAVGNMTDATAAATGNLLMGIGAAYTDSNRRSGGGNIRMGLNTNISFGGVLSEIFGNSEIGGMISALFSSGGSGSSRVSEEGGIDLGATLKGIGVGKMMSGVSLRSALFVGKGDPITVMGEGAKSNGFWSGMGSFLKGASDAILKATGLNEDGYIELTKNFLRGDGFTTDEVLLKEFLVKFQEEFGYSMSGKDVFLQDEDWEKAQEEINDSELSSDRQLRKLTFNVDSNPFADDNVVTALYRMHERCVACDTNTDISVKQTGEMLNRRMVNDGSVVRMGKDGKYQVLTDKEINDLGGGNTVYVNGIGYDTISKAMKDEDFIIDNLGTETNMLFVYNQSKGQSGDFARAMWAALHGTMKNKEASYDSVQTLVKNGAVDKIIAHSNGNNVALNALYDLEKKGMNLDNITYFGIAPNHGPSVTSFDGYKEIMPKTLNKNSSFFMHTDDQAVIISDALWVGSNPLGTIVNGGNAMNRLETSVKRNGYNYYPEKYTPDPEHPGAFRHTLPTYDWAFNEHINKYY